MEASLLLMDAFWKPGPQRERQRFQLHIRISSFLPVFLEPSMARTVNCIKLGREAEGLDFPPYPGELGKRIYESVSKEAWAAWLKQQTMLVNENRLNLADQRAREYLKRQMENHFFGGADTAAGYVPPQNGFTVQDSSGRDGLEGEFAPTWTVRRRTPAAEAATPRHCAVIGAGLAGAAVAASLARRGWRVTVLDAAERPATGASSVPAAVFAPHVSPDDALLSRLTRAGLRLTSQQLHDRLEEGVDWRASGVIERRTPGDDRLPVGWSAEGPNESWRADAAQLRSAGLPEETTALWHACGGWAKPAHLVAAWLAHPGVTVRCGARVERIEGIEPGVASTGWQLFDGADQLLVEADRVVIAAGADSAALAPRFPLQPVRGQVAWGRMASAPDLPPTPLNGDGHFIAHVPDADGACWLTGATFDRDSRDPQVRNADTEANRERLARLHPGAAAMLDDAFSQGKVQAWAGVRCASHDRRPLVGPCDPQMPQGPWLCSALGSRGLSFAVLCAELLAARWHAEPLPLPTALAAALDTGRAAPRVGARTPVHDGRRA
jgi:tRNA 5-methylaminomethyl-2-thiouridine biosynthesis bifunctional protein